ncbi:hypothetical protein SAMN05660479_02222 [Microbulbifer thermotolerans]|nr:hypothetical protein SAMN05660479_02222 [Microbulbifer thermotolerans]
MFSSRKSVLNKYRYDPVVTGVLVGIGALVLWYFSALAIDKKVLPAYFEHISRFFTVLIAALVGAFAAFRFNSMLDHKKRERETSQFYLDICLDNYEIFYKTLDGLNNVRVDWIYAARLLLETKELENEIIYKEHRRVLDVKKMKVRHDLLNQYQIIDHETNTESPLPVSFFYGVENWRDYIDSPDDAAYEAFRRDRPATFGEHEVSRIERLPMLSEHSVYIVFEFLAWPDDYDDPLRKHKYPSEWPNDVKNFQGEGAYKYAKHRQEYVHPEFGISKKAQEKIREMIKNGEVKIAEVISKDHEKKT